MSDTGTPTPPKNPPKSRAKSSSSRAKKATGAEDVQASDSAEESVTETKAAAPKKTRAKATKTQSAPTTPPADTSETIAPQEQATGPEANAQDSAATTPYRVLARKYRPTNFAELIGQDALVRTLSNAIAQGRVAQAFMLTGIRGVGKTTTARIIARALNCIGPDGKGGPTINPCGVCANCVAIAADRHVDVMEMDAASRTGVDDIRELIEGVRYRPVQARTKIYIIDEVHMLSKNAFNALLKTLEEPPEHVKFIFATTEIRKVPVTVLSRCQRFDLRRVDARILMEHFGRVSEQEGARVEDAALAAIARAADGSVRDGLSILDQAIALADGPVGEAQVREMLGLADRARLFDLIEGLLKGDAAPAIAILEELHRSGADPALVVQDLLDLTHGITRMKIAPSASGEAVMPESERVRGRALADTLSLGALTRAWSLLLKGLQDVQQSPAPHQAAEMVAIRMAYAASLPSPSDAMKVLTEGGFAGPGQITPGSGSPTHGSAPGGSALGGGSLSNGGAGGAGGRVDTNAPPDAPRAQMMQVVGGTAFEVGGPVGDPAAAHQTQPTATPSPAPQPDDSETAGQPRDFPELVALFEQNREAQLAALLRTAAHLVRFEQERLDLRLAPSVPKDFVGRVSECLRTWTGVRWVVTVSNEAGDPTLQQQAEETKKAEHDAVKEHPAVRAVLEAFPKAEIVAVRKHTALDAQAGGADEAAWIDPEDLAEDEDALEAALDFDAMHTLEDEEFE